MTAKPFFSFVPEEVIEQILARIPCTKSTVRCTSVCKSWYSIIKSSQFNNMYLHRPNSTKYLLCHTNSYRDGGFVDNYFLSSDSHPSKNRGTLEFPHGLKYVKVHGCSNGVICYTNRRREYRQRNIYLWNPTVRKLKILPLSRNIQEYNRYEYVKEAIGFWFDEDKCDYQVVKISGTIMTSWVDVYSLRNNSWRSISDDCPGINFSINEHNLVYAKGTLHWLAEFDYPGRGGSWRIVLLNLNNGNFQEALICSGWEDLLCLKRVDPNSLVILKMWNLHQVCTVQVHDERLELLYNDSDKSIYNDSDKSMDDDSFRLVGFRNNGEALLKLQNGTIVSYDFGAKQLTDVSFHFNNVITAAHPFVETLALINEG